MNMKIKCRMPGVFFLIILFSLSVCAQTPLPDKKKVEAVMKKACDWQLANMPDTSIRGDGSREAIKGTSWVRAAFYSGVMATYQTTGKKKYLNAAIHLGEKNNWQPGSRQRHADDHCIGQVYLDLYRITKDTNCLNPIRRTIDRIVENPMRGPVVGWKFSENWGWCDALFMAPPVFAKLAAITGNQTYLDTMHVLWMDTYSHLFDPTEDLYFRDAKYKIKPDGTFLPTKNGKKTFWGRGNGWVMSGLVRVLAEMPQTYQHRPYYVDLFNRMAKKIAGLQSDDGLWRVSLIDPDEFSSPEVSGSAFFCYALAWGINNNLLEREKYLPVVLKAWKGLEWAVDKKTGRIGWIQRIGHSPQSITADDTAEYGVGAFLLAGSEMCKLVSTK
jgi:unsaturated rhamnogalacturonyl hydrolase